MITLYILHTIGKQIQGLDRSILYGIEHYHIFLIRDPLDMIISWNVKANIHNETCSLTTLSLPILCDLYSELRSFAINKPIVIESNRLKDYSKDILMLLCNSIGKIYIYIYK